MTDFESTRRSVRAQSETVKRAREQLRAEVERAGRLARQAERLARIHGDDSAEVRRTREQQRRAEANASQARQELAAEALQEVELGQAFAPWTDPRSGIGQLDDQIPILLMPVRLETRFHLLTPPGAAIIKYELRVRVFPDDCWLDTFDPALTEKEVLHVRAYWAEVFAAGGVEAEERAAWVSIARRYGSGRAGWIVDNYQPLNLNEKPSKEEGEVVLVIVTTAPLPGSEQAVVTTYWQAVWRGQSNAAALEAADQALEAELGPQRAADIRESYRPVNLDTPLSPGQAGQQVEVKVAFVSFEEPETKQQAWAQAPRLTTLPDRFVFIGYRPGLEPLVALGEPVPDELIAGPDPTLPHEEQLQHDENGNLKVPEEIRWLFDFERAVEQGMGFKIPVDHPQTRFDRILVVGLRLRSDAQEAKEELETLFAHHARTRQGFGLLPQGTPTNNTESADAGFEFGDDPDRAFDDRRKQAFTPSSTWFEKRDGEWFAQLLGLDPGQFLHTRFADGTDQLTQRAISTALWPGTLGYWMESLLTPAFDSATVRATRDYFVRHVLGAGPLPALRIGAQPYGVLPTTAFTRMSWPSARGSDPFPRRVQGLLQEVKATFDQLIAQVSHVGGDGDPHQTLLDILGLHSRSVSFDYRIGEKYDAVVKRLELQGLEGGIEAALLSEQRRLTMLLLISLGYDENQPQPDLLDLVFGRPSRLAGGLVDDRPVSEREPLRAQRDDGQNYVEWLRQAATTSLDTLYRQEGFDDDRPPRALLYLFLRHALQLGIHSTSLKIHAAAGTYSEAELETAKFEATYLHLASDIEGAADGAPDASRSESRYRPMLETAPALTGDMGVADFIAQNVFQLTVESELPRQLEALEALAQQPTARLARAFTDHIDTLSYRLDAWWLSLVNYQLMEMRNLVDGEETEVRSGIHLGAFGWLENLEPEGKDLEPFDFTGRSDLEDEFGGQPPLLTDPTNQGHVHAPSLNHAVTAAVLRNAHNSSGKDETRDAAAVNLSSSRVRTALAMIEGIRQGQGLGDLLGYQFERGLHDRGGLIELDKFIYDLRKAFPLVGDKLSSTKAPEGTPIEDLAASHVLDGQAFAEHMITSGQKTYPFGKDLPLASQDEAEAITREAARLLDARDAVADLALTEGVHQAVLGNYERVASNYDAYARSRFPPEPDVVRTPYEGIGITHRVGLHLPTRASATESPVPAVAMTPRALAQPELNLWLAQKLPPLADVGCVAHLVEAGGSSDVSITVTLEDLGLQPIDLLFVVNESSESLSQLDERIDRYVRTQTDSRIDTPISIHYLEAGERPFSVFQLLPLMTTLRHLVQRSRPLLATDLMLMNEASSDQDEQIGYDEQRLMRAIGVLDPLLADLDALHTLLESSAPLSPDDLVDQVSERLERASSFSVAQAGWAFATAARQDAASKLLEEAEALVERLDLRLSRYDDLLTEYAALPAETSDEARIRLLLRAEQLVSRQHSDLETATVAALTTVVLPTKRAQMQARRDAFAQLTPSPHAKLENLVAEVNALLPVAELGEDPFSLESTEDAIQRLREQAAAIVHQVTVELTRRRQECTDAMAEADAAVAPSQRIAALTKAGQALLGEDFKLIPRIGFGSGQAAELDQARGQSESGALTEHLQEDFPVDTWLYGVARVRPKMRAWERLLHFAAALGQEDAELTPLQLPFTSGDRWVALELAPEQKLDHDRLLYTAHFTEPFAPSTPQVALLLDEWTEVIPGDSTDTGLVFHHDRPNSEAPQSMLLVTPSDHRGAWQWDDLVAALNDTLDLARMRGLEPDLINRTPYAGLLPATITTAQARQLTIAANLALNNQIRLTTLDE